MSELDDIRDRLKTVEAQIARLREKEASGRLISKVGGSLDKKLFEEKQLRARLRLTEEKALEDWNKAMKEGTT